MAGAELQAGHRRSIASPLGRRIRAARRHNGSYERGNGSGGAALIHLADFNAHGGQRGKRVDAVRSVGSHDRNEWGDRVHRPCAACRARHDDSILPRNRVARTGLLLCPSRIGRGPGGIDWVVAFNGSFRWPRGSRVSDPSRRQERSVDLDRVGRIIASDGVGQVLGGGAGIGHAS